MAKRNALPFKRSTLQSNSLSNISQIDSGISLELNLIQMVQWINIQKDCKDSIREAFGSTIWEISNHSQQTMVLHTQEPITRPILT